MKSPRSPRKSRRPKSSGKRLSAPFVDRRAACLSCLPEPYYNRRVKTLTVRLPEALVAEIEAESRARKLAKSDVVRERLSRRAGSSRRRRAPLDAIADLIGSVDGLPADLSVQRKRYLKTTGYGQKRAR